MIINKIILNYKKFISNLIFFNISIYLKSNKYLIHFNYKQYYNYYIFIL